MLVAHACATVLLLPGPGPLPFVAPRAALSASASDVWSTRIEELKAYKSAWGTADATPETSIGKWCSKQRELKRDGRLSPEREAELTELGLSWVSPSGSDALERCDWDEMCRRLTAYIDENGNAQVPKKLKTDPELGGWVATVRRTRGKGLSSAQQAQLEEIGFEWVSVRQCGSSFMKSFRDLRDYWEKYGTTEVNVANAASAEDEAALQALTRWCDAQRSANAKGLLPKERVTYLEGLGFQWS